MSATAGTVVGLRSNYPGTCTSFWSSCAFGNYVFVHNDDGTYSEYLHMMPGSVAVIQGQHVTPGQAIGQVGSTGYTGGFAHLHYSWLADAQGTGDSPRVGNSIPGDFIGIGHPTTGENVISNNTGSPLAYKTISVTEVSPGGQTLDLSHNAFVGESGTLKVTVKNTGTATWDSSVRLATDRRAASLLYNPGWLSAVRLAGVAGSVPPGGNYTFSAPVTVGGDHPAPTTPTSFKEAFTLVDENVDWFPPAGPVVGVSLNGTVDRGIVFRHHGAGGYVLAPDGAVTPFGGAPTLQVNANWPDWSIARGIVLRSDDLGGYILDGWGALHAFGNAPALASSTYWQGWDIARGIVLRSDDLGGYLLDGWGGLHAFGNAPAAGGNGYWPGTDTAKAIAISSDGITGAELDETGSVSYFSR